MQREGFPFCSSALPRVLRPINTNPIFTNGMKRLLLRPSLWVGFVAIAAYWNSQSLHGEFVYDDAGSVKRNIVVTGQVPWTELWHRDYWGTPMKEAQSHKSYRPITTATFVLNWKLAEWLGTPLYTPNHTYWFHVVNVVLHGLVTALLVEASSFIFPESVPSQLWVGLVFGLHPVHAEAVSNITSRGEMLMSAFFLVAFLSFASAVTRRTTTTSSSPSYWSSLRIMIQIHIVPWVCMACSLLSKEQGATTLMALVFFDYIRQFDSLPHLLHELIQQSHNTTTTSPPNSTSTSSESSELSPLRTEEVSSNAEPPPSDRIPPPETTAAQHPGGSKQQLPAPSQTSSALEFVARTLLLGLQTLVACAVRYAINGPTRPDFIEDQNPAGFASDRFTRAFSIPLVYCLYIVDIFWPTRLCPDWSGRSIALIRTWKDFRILGVLTLWTIVATCTWTLIAGSKQPMLVVPDGPVTLSKSSSPSEPKEVTPPPRRILTRRQQALIAFWAFVATPFLLSSNVLVVVGLMKADRVIYLPLAGVCMLQAIGIDWMNDTLSIRLKSTPQISKACRVLLHLFLLSQLGWYAIKVHERNLAWSTSELLWKEAYRINPISYHTMYNYGYELSLRRKFALAENVLRPIADPHVNGPSNTFVYALVLQNLDRCDEANALMNRALEVADQGRREAASNPSKQVRHSDSSYARVKSNLLVARSLCTKDVGEAGKLMYDAVQTDPTNEYAVEQAKHMLQHYERIQQQQQLLLAQMAATKTSE